MPNVHNPSPKTRGAMNHLALGVPTIDRAAKTLAGRGMQNDKPSIGRGGKRHLNLYDPNLTRAELFLLRP